MKENQNWYEKTKLYVFKLFKDAKKEALIPHFKRTVYWLLQLKPNADEALQIAALSHDIERGARDPQLKRVIEDSPQGFRDSNLLRQHSEMGASLIADFLTQQGAPREMVERVRLLVAGHEFSGTDDQNVLKDADSISYFENNIETFVKQHAVSFGKNKVKAKFDWMFNRITSEKARQIAAPLYHEAINQLENKPQCCLKKKDKSS